MDEEVVLVEDVRAFRLAARNAPRHALRNVVGRAGFRYSSNENYQKWFNTIMGSESSDTGTQSQTSKPQIQKVPDMLRDTNKNSKEEYGPYEPRVVSIGPYHRIKESKEELEIKYRVLRQFLEISDYPEDFFDRFAGQIMTLRDYYDDSTKGIKVEEFTKMMFLDGCFILYFIYCNVEYGVKKLRMKNHTIALVQQDLFLLENQLPFEVLTVLLSLSGSIPIERSMLDSFVDLNAIGLFTWTKDKQFTWTKDKQIQEIKPSHLLDLLWKRLVGRPTGKNEKHSQSNQQPQKVMIKGRLFRNVKELRAAGIHFRPNKTGCLRDVNFTSYGIFGKLTLPRIAIDSSTRPMFLNLIAHEGCVDNPAESWVISYLCFLGLLIYHADDVTELRTAGILENFLGSDVQVATLISEITGDLVPDFDVYGDVKLRMQDYFRHRSKIKMASWMAEVLRDHFKSPWTIIAVVAAVFAIFLTAVQTYVAVYPAPDKCNESICNYLRNKTL